MTATIGNGFQSGLFGGFLGKPWDDHGLSPQLVGIYSILVYETPGVSINAIQTTYKFYNGDAYPGPWHGSQTGEERGILLQQDETIIAFILSLDTVSPSKQDGSNMVLLAGLTVVTQLHGAFKQYGPYGNGNGAQGTVIGSFTTLYGATLDFPPLPLSHHISGLGFWGNSPLIVMGLQPSSSQSMTEDETKRLVSAVSVAPGSAAH